MRYLFIIFSLFQVCINSFGQNIQFLVGTYTGKTSQGIYQIELNLQTFENQVIAKTTDLTNPSFLTISNNKKKLYTVQETDQKGAVLSIDIANGLVAEKYSQKFLAEGNHPCHVSLSPNQKKLVVGNYSGGNFAVFDVKVNGDLTPTPVVINHSGNSINQNRQKGPHVHSTYWQKKGTELWVIDLGIDQLKRYNMLNNKISLVQSIKFEPGAGPRHLATHPNQKWNYVLNELNGTVSLLKEKLGQLTILQNTKGFDCAESELKSAADIHVSPNGKFLYASFRANRNHISVFSINSKTGFLKLVDTKNVQGKTPRNFAITPNGQFLLVANQDSDNITIFAIHEKTGLLDFTGKKIEISMPVCIKFL